MTGANNEAIVWNVHSPEAHYALFPCSLDKPMANGWSMFPPLLPLQNHFMILKTEEEKQTVTVIRTA